MKEIEIKVLAINAPQLCRKLERLGAKRVFDAELTSLQFDTPSGALGLNRESLRLRKQQDANLLTFKQSLDSQFAKVRNELEVEVGDFNVMRTILQALGFTVTQEVRKHRISYVLPGVRFEIDKYLDEFSYVPEFLEIEARNEAGLKAQLKLLGLKAGDAKPWNTQQVIDYYRKLKTKDDNHV